MRKISYYFIVCINFFLLFSRISNAQELIWAKAVSGPSFEYGVDADVDSQGNIFIIGYGTGPTLDIEGVTYNVNGEGGDAFIAKFSPDKELLWFKSLGGDDKIYDDEGFDIHVDNNNDVIILLTAAGGNFTYNGNTLSGINSPGRNTGEGVIIKIDNDGNYLWHDHGLIGSSFQSVITDSNQNIYITGWFRSSATLGGSIELINPTDGTTVDMLAAKYLPNGELQWAKHVGGTAHNAFAYGHKIAIDESSNKVIILGLFEDNINFETGTLSPSLQHAYSTFLVSYDLNGTELWRISIFNEEFSYCKGLDISPSGIIGVAGFNSLASNPLGLVGFYDLNGEMQSEEIYYSPEYCRLNSIVFNQFDECFITGRFKDSVTLGIAPDSISLNASSSGFLLKLDSTRKPIWTTQIPSLGVENKVTFKNNQIFYSGRIDEPLVYNNAQNTIINNSGDAIFAEISDSHATTTGLFKKNSTQDNFGISVFPNPTTNLIEVSFNYSKKQPLLFQLFDINGQLRISGTLNYSNTIGMESFDTGIYILKLRSETWSAARKILKY